MKKKNAKERAIILKKQDAIAFFGSSKIVADLLKMSWQGVCQWPEEIPEAPAWNLLHHSKKPKYAAKGKLKVVITI